MTLAFLNIGPFELIIMAAAAVMLFGGDLPQTARKAARMVGRLRGLASELGREFTNEMPERPKLDVDLDLQRLARLDDARYDPAPRPANETPDGTGDPTADTDGDEALTSRNGHANDAASEVSGDADSSASELSEPGPEIGPETGAASIEPDDPHRDERAS